LQKYDDKNEDWFEKEQLHFAAADGDLEKVKSLLAAGYPINAFDDTLSYTPLHYAAKENQLNVVRYLIEAGADVNANEEEKIGNTVLMHVAANCSFEMAKTLVDAGADPTIPGWMQLTALDKSMERKKPEGQKVHQLLVEAAKRCNPRWPRLPSFLTKRS
jgi:ankyrin repeat protein